MCEGIFVRQVLISNTLTDESVIDEANHFKLSSCYVGLIWIQVGAWTRRIQSNKSRISMEPSVRQYLKHEILHFQLLDFFESAVWLKMKLFLCKTGEVHFPSSSWSFCQSCCSYALGCIDHLPSCRAIEGNLWKQKPIVHSVAWNTPEFLIPIFSFSKSKSRKVFLYIFAWSIRKSGTTITNELFCVSISFKKDSRPA